jgi:hypothetical protein
MNSVNAMFPHIVFSRPEVSLVATASAFAGDSVLPTPSNPAGMVDWSLSITKDMGAHLTAAWAARAQIQFEDKLWRFDIAVRYKNDVRSHMHPSEVSLEQLDNSIAQSYEELVGVYSIMLREFSQLLVRDYTAAGGVMDTEW